MKHWILSLALALSIGAHAKPKGESNSSPNMFTVKVNGGFMLTSGDPDVLTKWHHDILYSYMFGAGFYYNFHLPEGFYLFGGPEIAYWMNEEEYTSSAANSFVSSTFLQFMVALGAGWQPSSLGGMGFAFHFSPELFGEKTTQFDSHGIKRSFGGRKTGVPFATGLSAYYAITPAWRPFIGYEYRSGHAIQLGVHYAF